MRTDIQKKTKLRFSSISLKLLAFLIVLGFAQMACNMPGQSSASTDAQYTIVAQTVAAELTRTAMSMVSGGTPVASQPANGQTGVVPTNTFTIPPVFTNTPGPTVTPKPTNTPKPTATPIPCNWVAFIKDVTVPDGTKKEPGVSFDKTWRLKNIGSCPWTSGYRLVFDHGDQMGAPAEMAFTSGVVNPGNVVDITVPLVAPSAPGTYQGFFKLKSSDGKIFGIGNTADKPFWVKIKVKNPKADLVVKKVEYDPFPPKKDQYVNVIITIKNQGNAPADGFRVVWESGEQYVGATLEWNIQNAIQPGEERMLIPASYKYHLTYVEVDTVVYVDVDNVISESNESNNRFTKTISVIP